MEHSPAPFHAVPDKYIHKRVSCFESGIYPNNAGLHEDIFICLDSFHKITHTITKDSSLQEAWLTFLCSTDVQTISSLISAFPFFAEIYLEIKDFLKQPEELINMFSKELYIMDRNMEKLMIEEWQEEMQATREELESTKSELNSAKEAFHVCKLRLEGKSRQEIAEALQITREKVDNILNSLN